MDIEQRLFERMKQRNEQAFRLFVERTKLYLFTVVHGIVRDRQEAEDVLQEVYVKIYHALPRTEWSGFKTWMTRVAVNHAIDWQRKRRDVVATDDVLAQETAPTNVEREVTEAMLREQVARKMDEMPANYRDVVVSFYMKQQSYQEIAEEQAVDVKTVETKLYRARQWLRKHWKEEEFR